jgi:hypothetical protein
MRDIWNRYARQEYTVFVDESFNRFLKMTVADSRYGYFSYGGVGVPSSEYASLRIAIAPILGDYLRLVPGGETEFKHSMFKRIPYDDRAMLADRIGRALLDHGAFISGFYFPGHSFVMEQVRDAVMYDEVLPDDTTALYEAAVEELRERYYAQGDKSELLSAILTLPVSAWANMLAAFGCPFRVIYDPRERQEDLSVKARIDGLRIVMERTSPRTKGLFRGLDVGSSSETEPGLQLADLVAGETREFLAAFPEMMSHGATRKIISQESAEDFEAMTTLQLEGRPPTLIKFGAMTEMTEAMVKRFIEPDAQGRTVMHRFSVLLVSGTLTGYSKTGNPRHLMPFIGGIVDQSDR